MDKCFLKRATALFIFLFTLFFLKQNLFAAQGTVNINANLVSGLTCWFNTSNATINLGDLIPGSNLDITSSATLRFRCFAVGTLVYSITDDDGLHEPSPGLHRLKHITDNEYINYEFDYNPKSETIVGPPWRIIRILRTLNITVTVPHNSYQNASVGNYFDVVTLTLLP